MLSIQVTLLFITLSIVFISFTILNLKKSIDNLYIVCRGTQLTTNFVLKEMYLNERN